MIIGPYLTRALRPAAACFTCCALYAAGLLLLMCTAWLLLAGTQIARVGDMACRGNPLTDSGVPAAGGDLLLGHFGRQQCRSEKDRQTLCCC
jgi:hypothetical protein